LSERKGCLFLQDKSYKEDGDRSKRKEKKDGEEWKKSVVKIFYFIK
jgi:hypothetical protein